jgi:hypothetical protein
MYPVWVWLVALGFLAVWLLVLSFLIWQQGKFLKSLFPQSGERDIRKKFEELTKRVEGFGLTLGDIDKHVQRVELLRFNPYDDTGGDQSFTVALLDGEATGVVLTSLHARAGTRVFAKDIKSGKSKYALSEEEKQVLDKAMEK